MTITIKIETDNAAFSTGRQREVRRILKEWLDAGALEGLESRNLRDVNGNTVGSVTVRGK